MGETSDSTQTRIKKDKLEVPVKVEKALARGVALFGVKVAVVDNAHNSYGLPLGRWPSENMPCKLDEILHFESNSSPEGVCLPGYYPYNFCELCTISIPVQITSVSSVRHSHPYPELL